MSADITFHTKDRFGSILPETSTDVITGFTGDIFPFTFTAFASSTEDSTFSKSNIVWDFGDTNSAIGLSATHIYKVPGEYQVSVSIFNRHGLPSTSNTVKTLKIYNIIGDDLIWQLNNSSTPVVTAGKLSEQLNIVRQNSWQSYNALSGVGYYTINLYASGSPSNYYDASDDIDTKYSQYLKTWRFVESSNNITPVQTLSTSIHPIYYRIPSSGATPIKCTPDAANAILVGTSGVNMIHYIDDNYKSTGLINLVASLDTKEFPSTYTLLNNVESNAIDSRFNYDHRSVATLPVSTTHNIPTQLIFTSNGIKGFDIKPNKWQYSPVSYVISLADADGNILKGYPALSAGSVCESYHVEQGFINTDDNDVTFYTVSGINTPTHGSLTNIATISALTSNESITARCNITDHLGVTQYLTGSSNTFNIYPASGEYVLSKVNEDFDFTSTLKSFVLQESLNSSYNFMEWFVDSAFGGKSGITVNMGKSIYEKISNFVSNNADIDECGINGLYSIADQLDYNIKNFKYSFPAGIKRLVNLLSINHKRLIGQRSQSNKDFNRGEHTYTGLNFDRGKNLGNIITLSSYSVTAGVPIVANQLFNDQYAFINTMVISGADGQPNYSSTYNGLTSYALSSYNSEWGWGLSIPGTAADSEVGTYYDFYEYVDNSYYPLSGYSSTGIIDWNNDKTTVVEQASAITTWRNTDGIIDSMFDHQIRTGLGLFTLNTSNIQISGVKEDTWNC